MRGLIGLVALLIAAAAGAAPLTSRALAAGWQVRLVATDAQATAHAEATAWHAATVPGNVHTDLLANGLIADPYAGAAEGALQWIGLGQWEYRTRFDVDAATLHRRHHELVFEGLDTFAQVWLNGQRALSADNAFRTWRVPVAHRLRARGNELRVVFDSPIVRLLPAVQAMPHKLAGNYPSPYGDEPRDAMTQNFARKPGYHYGWDWGPRYVTAGIWRPVTLQSWDALRLADLHVEQVALSAGRASLAVQAQLQSSFTGSATLRLEVLDPDGKPVVTKTQRLITGGADRIRTVVIPVQLAAPRRWWPVGYGEQALYQFRLAVLAAGVVQARGTRRTGLRTVSLKHEHDAFGDSFTFVVNGVEVFAKGANVIPFDAFPARATYGQQARVLAAARAANMNMLRDWGGGYYESDGYFDLADRLGLMIWQDFMFGGGVVPAYDPAFRASVAAEARDNVRRLRDHPSLVLWCGNNEEEAAWNSWGYGDALRQADPAFAAQVWAGYRQLFGGELRRIVAQQGGGVPYWSSTPGNDLDGNPNDDNRGDRHYWEVWAEAARPVEAYLEATPRFMSEYGLQSWPSLRTLASIARPEEMQIDGAVIRAHQKFLAGDGNTRLLQYIRADYREPGDFADFVYLSQVMQSEGIELAALHHRASRPRTMGTMYWQLNDVWPGASWSSVDWYGRWKPLQFHARRFYADRAVAALRRDGRTSVTLVSDAPGETRGELQLRVLDFAGNILRAERRPVRVAGQSALAVANFTDAELLRGADRQRTAAVFDWLVDGAAAARRVVYFDAAKNLALPDPGLRTRLTHEGGAYRLDVHAERLARELWLDFGDVDAEVSDNALTLLAGESATLRVNSRADLATLRSALTWRSLNEPVPGR